MILFKLVQAGIAKVYKKDNHNHFIICLPLWSSKTKKMIRCNQDLNMTGEQPETDAY